jgi:hypothetical protein
MTTTASLIQSLAQRDAHRLAQKVSVLAMASLVLLCQWSSKVIAIATPDEAMMTLIMGVLVYLVAKRAARAGLTGDRQSEEELMLMFVIDDQHQASTLSMGSCR